MKKSILLFALLSIFSCHRKCHFVFGQSRVISQPVLIEDEGWSFEGTENMIFVPENRSRPNSRKIALHFFRFPAREKSELPAVVFLGAGPGEPYSVDVFYQGKRAEAWRFELDIVNQKREVILINQRGNSEAPGLQIPAFEYRWANGSIDVPFDFDFRAQNRKKAYAEQIGKFEDQGVDLAGYDVINFVDDIESVRSFCGYDKIALIGNSFASQWALGYMQRYPNNVDRALLSCVEPLDHNYDDPDGIWEVFEKINTYALADSIIAKDLPPVGLLEAFKEIINRLEAEPQLVHLDIPAEGIDESIYVGADDFRFARMNPYARSYADDLNSWPKYITELYNGDYRTLALRSRGRGGHSSSLMINPLFNNSLGVSSEREAMLNSRASVKWLGDINAHYTATRDVCPAPKVSDEFRQHIKHDIPVLLIHGDMDLSTPYGNALFLMDYLENGHLITVKGGSHNAKRALILGDPLLAKNIYRFMNIDFNEQKFQDFKVDLPTVYDLPKYEFWPVKEEALFEKYTKD